MVEDLWANHPFIQHIGNALLDRHERTTRRPTRLPLDAANAPHLHKAQSEEGQLLERLLESFERTGIVRVVTKPAPRGLPRALLRDSEPKLELVDENGLRALLGRPVMPDWQDEFMLKASEVFGDYPALLEYLRNHPLRTLESIPPAAVCRGLLQLRQWADGGGLTRRQAAGRAFGGLSKALDSREELLRILTGYEEPFPEAPVHLLARAGTSFSQVLFVENEDTFAAMAAKADKYENTALIWAAGFRGSAERLRGEAGCVLYVAPLRTNQNVDAARSRLEAWRQGALSLPVHFFGDLDYSGMAILKALRRTLGDVRAWLPGYRLLLQQLEGGRGHVAAAAGKERQVDPGSTGDAFADEILLPAMRTRDRCFVDQEVWEEDDDAAAADG